MEDGVLIAPALIQPRQLFPNSKTACRLLKFSKAEVKFNTVPIQPVEPSIWFLQIPNRFKARVVASIGSFNTKKPMSMEMKKTLATF
jgi:hypothetical protein